MSIFDDFERIVSEQIKRNEKIKADMQKMDSHSDGPKSIGMIDGDGIGPIILSVCWNALSYLLKDEIDSGNIVLKKIDGLTLENRISKMVAVPEDVLEEIKTCDVILKGPTTTPSAKSGLPNIESANVALRRELDLFANVRPVSIPEKDIQWIFYRENTEGEYALGSKGIDLTHEISMDFKVTTDAGTKRLAKAAFEYARMNGNLNVSIITKANIMKKTDGRFLKCCMDIAAEYPEIAVDDWFVDITAANLVNESIRSKFQVFILPNLYGDIITDEAAQIQGGMGTAGSANIGARHAMFEAVHGSAPRMVEEGIADHADPTSILKAAEMMLRHIGYATYADTLSDAISHASAMTRMSGDGKGDTAYVYEKHLIERIQALICQE